MKGGKQCPNHSKQAQHHTPRPLTASPGVPPPWLLPWPPCAAAHPACAPSAWPASQPCAAAWHNTTHITHELHSAKVHNVLHRTHPAMHTSVHMVVLTSSSVDALLRAHHANTPNPYQAYAARSGRACAIAQGASAARHAHYIVPGPHLFVVMVIGAEVLLHLHGVGVLLVAYLQAQPAAGSRLGPSS